MSNYKINKKIPSKDFITYISLVYTYMFFFLFITFLLSIFISVSPKLMYFVHVSYFKLVVIFLPFIMASYIPSLMMLSDIYVITASFFFAVSLGLSISSIFISFSGESIISSFFISCVIFGMMSIYSIYTKKDLSGMRVFLIILSTGLFVTGIVNILYMRSGIVFFMNSMIGVFLFALFTAYDMQKIKSIFYNSNDKKNKLAIYASLTLYMNFINIFAYMVQLVGNRRKTF